MSRNIEESKANSDALVVISSEYSSTPIGLTKPASHHVTESLNDDAPRIICNELLVKPQQSTSLEKLDELSSLEREIAKMHHADDETNLGNDGDNFENSRQNEVQMPTLSTNSIDNNSSNGGAANVKKTSGLSLLKSSYKTNLEDKLDAITSGETALDHEDLIAVLKGLDGGGTTTTDDTHNISGASAELDQEGVTIEGEGEYQIMEVIDDDSNAAEENATKDADKISGENLNKKKTFGKNTLTLQEERALALEQMEVLNNVRKKPIQKPIHRRKQEIKPIKQVDPALDLVSALEAEWSENDDDINNEKPSTSDKSKLSSTAEATKTSTTSATTTNKVANKSNVPLITSVVVIPTQVQTTVSVTSTVNESQTVASTATANITPSSATEDNMSTKSSSPVDGVVETKTEEVLPAQPGFRRTRIIKRKIIWDPDAPETTFSYAKLVKPNTNNTTKSETIPTNTITKGSTTITPIKKETPPAAPAAAAAAAKKIQRPTTPKDKKISTELSNEKKIFAKPSDGSAKATAGEANNKSEESVTKTTSKTSTNNTTETKGSTAAPAASSTKASPSSPVKRRSQTPVTNGPGGSLVKKKKVTEVDRLMGDEGAVNMLNSLEKMEATLAGTETKPPTRPMMRSRAATICEKLPRKEPSPAKITSPNNTSPSPTTNTQTNKSGKRTNKSRPSSTWDYVYKKKKQDFDDSLIIRRRSNSSYSSTASPNRLSLDGPPSSIANSHNTSSTKTNDKNSSPASTTTTPTSSSTTKASLSSANQNKSAGSSKNNSNSPSPGKSFEFAKPENKKTQRRTKSPAATLTNDMKKSAPAANKRNTRSPDNSSDDIKEVKTSSKSPPTASILKERKDLVPPPTTVSDVVVKKSSKVAQIIFSTNKAKLSNTFTIQMLNKLVDILDKLASDPDCHVVVITTNDTHFCQGIDLTDLTKASTEKRKNYAGHMATSVKNYLKTLATYPKPLIAGVNGTIMNFGVIQLAFFDIVIAGDKTTFEAPYAKMGQLPEGYCIWNNMNKLRGSFRTKLFWLSERVQSTEAALSGLLNKLTSPSKVNDDALTIAKKIANGSAETYRAMKKTIVNSHLDVIANSLDDEFETIIKQWSSSECLENIKKIVEQGHY